MSDFRERFPDDQREVPIDDQEELKLPPPTIDPLEAVEADEDEDEQEREEREAAIEAGEIEPDG